LTPLIQTEFLAQVFTDQQDLPPSPKQATSSGQDSLLTSFAELI
jgi:hypothetical protein